MFRKITSLLAASAVAIAAFAPVEADARHRRDYYNQGYNGYDCRNDGRRDSCRGGYGYDRHRNYRNYGRHYYRDRDNDDGEVVAAGVIGLVLGLAIGAAADAEQRRPDGYYDNRRYDPYANRRDDRYYEQGYDDPRQQCWRRERQWDRYANRYVYVDVPC